MNKDGHIACKPKEENWMLQKAVMTAVLGGQTNYIWN